MASPVWRPMPNEAAGRTLLVSPGKGNCGRRAGRTLMPWRRLRSAKVSLASVDVKGENRWRCSRMKGPPLRRNFFGLRGRSPATPFVKVSRNPWAAGGGRFEFISGPITAGGPVERPLRGRAQGPRYVPGCPLPPFPPITGRESSPERQVCWGSQIGLARQERADEIR